jgi:hypothetical protein
MTTEARITMALLTSPAAKAGLLIWKYQNSIIIYFSSIILKIHKALVSCG